MTSMPVYLLDTHAVYWYLIASKRLSGAARQAYMDASSGRATLIIYHVVLAELFFLLNKKQQLPLFRQFLNEFLLLPGFGSEPLVLSDIEQLPAFPEIPEMHDRLIAIAAKRLGATIVTSDSKLHASPQVRCLW